MRDKILTIAFIFSLSAVFFACGKSDDSKKTTDESTQEDENEDHNLTTTFAPPASSELGFSAVGHNTAEKLKKLAYLLGEITICENIEVSSGGSGYSNPTGCTTVYKNDNEFPAKVADAPGDNPDIWLDLMDPDSLSTASGQTSTVTPGTYNFVIVEVGKVVLLDANIDVGNENYKTCTGGTVYQGDQAELTQIDDMVNCEQAEIALGWRGGGHWFKFTKPVVIEEGKKYSLDIVSNPEGALIGLAAAGSNGPEYWDGDPNASGHSIYLPQSVPIVPVVREVGQSAFREQYELTAFLETGVNKNAKIVVDLYFAGEESDIGTATVVSATTRWINDPEQDQSRGLYNPYSSKVEDDGSLTLLTGDDTTIVSGLTRSTTSTAGGVSNAMVGAGVLPVENGETPPVNDLDATVTFKGLVDF